MTKIKKTLAVIGIICVIACAVVIPCSAISIPVVDNDGLYLYTPVTLEFYTYSRDPLGGAMEWDITQDEYEPKSKYDNIFVTNEDIGQEIEVTNAYTPYNGGYKGSTTVALDDTENTLATELRGFRLPSVWAFRSLKVGANAPYIKYNGYDSAIYDSLVLNYSCRIMHIDTNEVITWNFTQTGEVGNLIQVFPNNLAESLPSGWGNYVILDYRCDIFGVQIDHSATIPSVELVLPLNGGSARGHSFSAEYTESYIERVADGTVEEIVVEQQLRFTDFLVSAFGFLDVPLFGEMTIGGLLAVIVSISLLLVFLKIFAGG